MFLFPSSTTLTDKWAQFDQILCIHLNTSSSKDLFSFSAKHAGSTRYLWTVWVLTKRCVRNSMKWRRIFYLWYFGHCLWWQHLILEKVERGQWEEEKWERAELLFFHVCKLDLTSTHHHCAHGQYSLLSSHHNCVGPWCYGNLIVLEPSLIELRKTWKMKLKQKKALTR